MSKLLDKIDEQTESLEREVQKTAFMAGWSFATADKRRGWRNGDYVEAKYEEWKSITDKEK